jgi:4-hydroxy-3-methylbut-2-enyl diphosphate reductase
MTNQPKKIILAKPRGFCAGVTRAVKIVERALEKYGAPVYVKHQIVHNRRVVETLKKRGARFVESLNGIPAGSIIIFSAHGVPPKTKKDAEERKLKIIDAACPLVNKVHLEAKKFSEDGYAILLIGHKGHEEVVGVVGEAPSAYVIENLNDLSNLKISDSKKVACLTQTTISFDEAEEIIKALKKKFPRLALPPKKDICYTTQNRQTAAKEIAKEADLFLVIGSKSSSNSKHLREVAEKAGAASFLISDLSEIDEDSLGRAKTIGITAGASTPDITVKEVLEFIKNKFPKVEIEERGYEDENIVFPLPAELS